MAEGDGVADHEIRVRLDRTASESDIGALKKWLERETPLDRLARAGELRIDVRRRTDAEPGAPMGIGSEIVVHLVDTGTSVVFVELLHQVRLAVQAWRSNRRDVENGEPPGADVDGVGPDDR
ncbi:hypothetical protein ACH4ZX_28450 [Streptomyces sp. NPDC020490]|uniref:hypothetical protein n=1 Tax=Streptomyces sp. NPDC020490 TaxID=3365078 RepID=UPI0037B1E16A